MSTQESPSVENSIIFKSNEMDQTGLFQKAIVGLKPSTKYYCRAFVLRNDINVYGSILTFETIGERTVMDLSLFVLILDFLTIN